MIEVFVAYASGNQYHGEMLRRAAEKASTAQRKILPWSDRDTSAFPISRSVEDWIEKADAFVGDISVVNDNVTFEIGLAIGLGKPCRFIRSTHVDYDPVKKISLFDTLGHEEYGLQPSLERIFSKSENNSKWAEVSKLKNQPIFILQPPAATPESIRIISSIKKVARLRFRGFIPQEISRLSASEAYEQVASSFGVVATWSTDGTDEGIRNNQRAAFIFGLARGLGVPAILVAHDDVRLPLDLHDLASRWKSYDDIDSIVAKFRNAVADNQNDFIEVRSEYGSKLENISCGDPTAENEAAGLSHYFLETEGYQRALNGEANVLVGRKGSGKTAVFLRVRDRTRVDKSNIIIDLIPDGYQLVKMKEFILDQLSFGSRKEFIAAFWEYVLWLEIAYKLLEKDAQRAYRDSSLLNKYEKLMSLYNSRVDTGAGDFSERLKRLATSIIERFENHPEFTDGLGHLKSSEVLEVIYGQDIRALRDAVLEYLRIKGFVFFMVDNLDRFWTPGGFDKDDTLIVVGLIESMQEISRKFSGKKLDFRWSIFLRSDVYEFLIAGMADYGKLSIQSLEWIDRDLMKMMFEKRVLSNFTDEKVKWKDVWEEISEQYVQGIPTLEFLVDASLMRPRYLIRLFETARRRAITFGRVKIEEADYLAALKELGWQVMEDLDREIADLVPNNADLLFSMIQVDKPAYAGQAEIRSSELRRRRCCNGEARKRYAMEWESGCSRWRTDEVHF